MAQTFNENIEIQTLACLFKDGSLYPVVEDILEKKAFAQPHFQIIFQAIKDVVDADLYPDSETVATDLDRKGLLLSLSVPSQGVKGKDVLNFLKKLEVDTEQLESYAYQVQELYANRQLLALAEDMKNGVENGKRPIEILSDMDLKSGRIAAFVGSQSQNTKNSNDVAKNNIQQLQDTINGVSTYISTHFLFWDDFFGGIAKRLYMIAGEQNEGKSTLVLNLIKNIAIAPPKANKDFKKTKVKLFTFESSAEEIQNKLVQMMTGISVIRIEKAELSEDELVKYKNALTEIANSPILYDDSSEITLPLLRTKIRKAVADGAEIIFVDQLEQILLGGSGDAQPEHVKLNYISYRLKAYQREMDTRVVIVHQRKKVGEESRNRDPELSDLNQAGGKAPDGVAMVRTKKDPAIFVVKNRQGPKGKRDIGWEGSKITFSDNATGLPDFVQDELANHE